MKQFQNVIILTAANKKKLKKLL